MSIRRVSLVLLASLIHICIGIPLQIHLENVVEKKDGTMAERPEVEPPDVFSLILASNKESKALLYEGDIAVNLKRNALKCDDNSCRWTKNSTGFVNVPYNLSSTYSSSDIAVFLGAMQEFATLTCVRFIPRSTESDYVQIIADDGCWSIVGKQGGSQIISVSRSCMVQGSIQHELNHALGFFHEQNRSDRDDYVNIIYSNIIPGNENNFQALDTLNQGIEYDYGSVMHYPRTAFSVDGISATIVPKPDASIAIGQRYGLSNLDVAKINKLYDCGLCRTLLSGPSGSLASSNYPNNYPAASSCLWLIRVPSNKVFLKFLAFDVQNSAGCASDYLRIYDGPTTSSPVLLDRACGAGQLPPMVSTTNKMLLEFVSDNSTAATGFKASYSTVTCGSVLRNRTGTFSTPNYPSNYPAYMDCTWVVTAPIGYQVSVNVTDFNVEYRNNCGYDYMLVFNGPETTSPLMGKFCGTSTIPTLISTGNTLVFQFHSDESIQLTGFLAEYAFVTCGSVLSNQTGTFSTPNYPSNYPPYMDCTWVVTAPIGYQVSVNVTDFNVEYMNTCSYDYMLVFNGPKTTSPLMGKFCGKSTIPTLTSTGNTLVFQFHSNAFVQLKGFFAKYAFVKQ